MSDNFYEGDEVPNMADNPYLMAKFSSQAMVDIAAERRRQVEQEGWTPQHDDEHAHGEMASAAAAYAFAGSMEKYRERLTDTSHYGSEDRNAIKKLWPWDWKWWKPKDRRRDLVRAGALIVAEIERLDRANSQPKT